MDLVDGSRTFQETWFVFFGDRLKLGCRAGLICAVARACPMHCVQRKPEPQGRGQGEDNTPVV